MSLNKKAISNLAQLIRLSFSLFIFVHLTSACSAIGRPNSVEVPIIADMKSGEKHAANQFLMALKRVFDQGLKLDPAAIEREFGFRIFDWRDDRVADGKNSGDLYRTQDGSIGGFIGGLSCRSQRQSKRCVKLIFGTVNQREKEPVFTKDAVSTVFGNEFELRWVTPISPHGNASPWMIFQNTSQGTEAEITFELVIRPNESVGNSYVRSITLITKPINQKTN